VNAQPIRLDDAENYLERVVTVLHTLSPERKGPLIAVLSFLLSHIGRVRAELNTLRTDAACAPSLLSAVDELEEIVQETAAATDKIMDATESIERIARSAPPDVAAALRAEATRIYEASAFQDITGQRITKAIRAFQSIERHVTALIEASGEESLVPPQAGTESLVNGPQLAGRANSQADIDRLLESLG